MIQMALIATASEAQTPRPSRRSAQRYCGDDDDDDDDDDEDDDDDDDEDDDDDDDDEKEDDDDDDDGVDLNVRAPCSGCP